MRVSVGAAFTSRLCPFYFAGGKVAREMGKIGISKQRCIQEARIIAKQCG